MAAAQHHDRSRPAAGSLAAAAPTINSSAHPALPRSRTHTQLWVLSQPCRNFHNNH
jgi:hypothetical protein